MAHEPGAHDAAPSAEAAPKKQGANVWMIVALVALALAAIASYLAFSYKGQVDDWEAAAQETIAALKGAGVELQGTVESGVAGYEQQISDLTGALEQSQTEAGISSAQLQETEAQLADTQAELESTQQELADTQADLKSTKQDLKSTQAELDDANAQLAQVGQFVLDDGTYSGQVLAARTAPVPAILFQDGDAWRVAEVASDVTITVGDQSLTLVQFSQLLQSTDPATVELVNGDYDVVVADGLVMSISKA